MDEASFADLSKIAVGQLRRYERGTSRISARQLYEFAVALQVPVTYFFGEFRSEADFAAHKPLQFVASAEVDPHQFRSALRSLLAVVDLADRGDGVDDQHYQTARESARALLAGLPSS